MICPYCGKENPDNTQYCDFCGGPLAIPAEEPVTEAPPVEAPSDVLPPTTQAPVSEIAPSEAPPKPAKGIFGNRIWWFVGCVLVVVIIVGCGVLAWGLYRITTRQTTLNPATVTPTLGSIPTAVNPIIFSDDFSNPNSGWDRINDTDYYTDYYNNAYRITINSSMYDSWANPDDNVFSNVSIEVDATKNGGPDDNDFGVICRYQSVDKFYYAVISSDGYFGITKVTSASSTLLGRDNLEASDAINQGFATNHIRFDCNGNVLTLYVNGQQIDQQTDSDYSTGNVGLLAGTYDTPGTDILFDNFIIYQP
jgi:zinc-ribbon domain